MFQSPSVSLGMRAGASAGSTAQRGQKAGQGTTQPADGAQAERAGEGLVMHVGEDTSGHRCREQSVRCMPAHHARTPSVGMLTHLAGFLVKFEGLQNSTGFCKIMLAYVKNILYIYNT